MIRGAVTGPVADRDSWRAPDTRVVHTSDVSGRTGRFTLRIPLGRVEESCYIRLRGSGGRERPGAEIDRERPGADAGTAVRAGPQRVPTRQISAISTLSPLSVK